MTSAAHKGEATDAATEIVVGGLTPLSTADWPGMLAATVFCRGCAWACPYCHNAGLRAFGTGERSWPEVLAWLTTRRGLLDAVVFSGGEPLLQPGLAEAMRQVRALGFEVGLHTSGMVPQALERVLPLCGWVGLDLKAPRRAYAGITGAPGSAEDAWASLTLLRESCVAFELRTTWHPALMNEEEFLELAGEIAPARAPLWALQAFQPEGCADADLATAGRTHVPDALTAKLREALGPNQPFVVRN